MATLRSSGYTPKSLVKYINVCGTLMAFEGIQLTLQDTSSGNNLFMLSMGSTQSCVKLTIATGAYVNSVLLGYSSSGVSYIKITSSDGSVMTRGTLLSTNSQYKQSFSPFQPFVGLNGYVMGQTLSALGFISYTCLQTVPSAPNAPILTFNSGNVIISWSLPSSDGGSNVVGYQVNIQQSDGLYSVDLTNCNSLNNTSTTCTIPAASLTFSPFNLAWGSNVYATVQAINAIGTSNSSAVGSGATIVTVPSAPINLIENNLLRTSSSLALTWSNGNSTGGLQIISYIVSMSTSGGTYKVISANITNLSFLATGLTSGINYSFYVQARNSYGNSSNSQIITLLCAYKPLPPSSVTTSNLGNQILIKWTSSINNGSPITAYQVYIQQYGSTQFIQENTNCVGTVLLQTLNCQVSLNDLQTSPYSLIRGSNVTAQVIATNVYGNSNISSPGSGAVIWTTPDPPINLQNNAQITSDTLIGFNWLAGAQNGGQPILDYTIFWDQGNQTFIILAQNVTSQNYTTSVQLIAGVTYQFQVTARNSIGNSQLSSLQQILAARVPNAPSNLANDPSVTNAYQIGLNWDQNTYNGGSSILSYQVSYSRNQTYFVYSSNITNTFITINNLLPGSVYSFFVQAQNIIGLSPKSQIISVLAAQVPDPPINLQNLASITNSSQVGISYLNPVFNGGSPISQYRIWFAPYDSTNFTIFIQNLTYLNCTITGLMKGQIYQFKVDAGNSLGFGNSSNIINVLAANQPAQPTSPITIWSPNNVIINWTAPDNGGSPIISYKVSILQSDNVTLSSDLTYCDGSNQTILTSQNCIIPVSVLISAPFSLRWGSKIYAQIIATNIYGNSFASQFGSGAIITTNPSPPISLIEDQSKRSITQLGLIWQSPSFNGGSQIIDYQIGILFQNNSYQLIASEIINTSYVAQNLQPGVNYTFVVQSRNSYGLSNFSQPLILLCAFVPSQPSTPTTIIYTNLVIVQWSEPNSNGSPISSYKVLIQQHNSTIFTQEKNSCVPNSATMLLSQQCNISLSVLMAAPYLLILNEPIFAKVIASNFYGDSLESLAGSNSQIQTVPDAPINLQNDLSATTAQKIRFTWTQGVQDGGTPIIYYNIYYDQGNNTNVLLSSQVWDLYFMTQIQLKPNTVYQFRVAAVNSIGSSLLSQPISIRAASLPNQPPTPQNIQNVTTGYQVGLDWSQINQISYYDGGSPIIDYQISYAIISLNSRLLQSYNYTLCQSGIIQTNYTVKNLTPGVEYIFVLQSRNLIGLSQYSQPISVTAAQPSNSPTNLQNVASLTSASQIGLQWQAPQFNGGSQIIDYSISYKLLNENLFTNLVSGVTTLNYTADYLTQGQTYQFVVQARNSIGYSPFSNIVNILAAQIPDIPLAPITQFKPDNVIISWQAPNNGGSPIIGYQVFVKQNDSLTYSNQITNCSVSQSTVTSCLIPVSILMSSPFYLNWGDNIVAKVQAINIYGTSLISPEGSGAIITTNPDAPINLIENSSLRSVTTLGFDWSQPLFNGGSQIIDYRVSQLNQNGSLFIISQGVNTTSFQAQQLVNGFNYTFYVESRNSYGYSKLSQKITLLCAFKPNAPSYIVIKNIQNYIQIDWALPSQNGSPITGYKVYIQMQNSTQFTQEINDCTKNSTLVLYNRTCSILLQTLRNVPFSLNRGANVFVQVIGSNIYGDSALSQIGTGAVVWGEPDAPILLQNYINITSNGFIYFSWIQGLYNGGQPVIDYTVVCDQGSEGSQFISLASNLTTQYYLTNITLIQGATFQFEVIARNSLGYSQPSSPILIAQYISQNSINLNSNFLSGNSIAAGATVAGVSVVLVVIAVVISLSIVIICIIVGFIIYLRKYKKKVFPIDAVTKNSQDTFEETKLERQESNNVFNFQKQTVKKLSKDDSTFDLQQTNRIPNPQEQQLDPFQFQEGDEHKDKLKQEAALLKGKNVFQKRQLLNDLQKQKEREIQMQYQLSRQQLRHDEITANRRIQEQERIDDVFKVIFANVAPENQKHSYETANTQKQQSDKKRNMSQTLTKMKLVEDYELKALEADMTTDQNQNPTENKLLDQEDTLEPLFMKRLAGNDQTDSMSLQSQVFNVSETDGYKRRKAQTVVVLKPKIENEQLKLVDSKNMLNLSEFDDWGNGPASQNQ